MQTKLKAGDRVEVKWARHGWLPGTVQQIQTAPDHEENFLRVQIAMDNGFGCDGTGFHPDCVRLAA